MRSLLVFARVIRFDSLCHDGASGVTMRKILTLRRNCARHIAGLRTYSERHQSRKNGQE